MPTAAPAMTIARRKVVVAKIRFTQFGWPAVPSQDGRSCLNDDTETSGAACVGMANGVSAPVVTRRFCLRTLYIRSSSSRDPDEKSWVGSYIDLGFLQVDWARQSEPVELK